MKYFLGIFFLIGMYMLGTSLFAGFKYLSANDWLSTRDVVEQVSTQIVSSKPSTSAVTLRYAYEVNDPSYHNDRLRFGLNIASNTLLHLMQKAMPSPYFTTHLMQAIQLYIGMTPNPLGSV